MTNIITYCNKELGNVRTILDSDNEVWFVAKDVAEILGYDQTYNLTRRLESNEIDKISVSSFKEDSVSPRHIEPYTIINEPGLYRAIFASKKPQARAFQDWVYSEVLPSIRKTGHYGSSDDTKEIRNLLSELEKKVSKLDKYLKRKVSISKKRISKPKEYTFPEIEIKYIKSEVGDFPILEFGNDKFILDKHLSALYGKSVTCIQRFACRNKRKLPKNSFRRSTKIELQMIKECYKVRDVFPCMPMLYTYGACLVLARLLDTYEADKGYLAITKAFVENQCEY